MRRIQISEEALQDLTDGFLFYEAQEVGLGDDFTSCLRADIASLRLYAGIHRSSTGITIDCSARYFHTGCSTLSTKMPYRFGLSLI